MPMLRETSNQVVRHAHIERATLAGEDVRVVLPHLGNFRLPMPGLITDSLRVQPEFRMPEILRRFAAQDDSVVA